MPKKVTLCHWVFSCEVPSRSLRTLVLARLILLMAMPPCVYLVSGSLPRLPTRMALLMPRAMDDRVGVRLLACRPPSAPRPPDARASARLLPAHDTGTAGAPCLDQVQKPTRLNSRH